MEKTEKENRDLKNGTKSQSNHFIVCICSFQCSFTTLEQQSFFQSPKRD